jgi:hypothetical protein
MTVATLEPHSETDPSLGYNLYIQKGYGLVLGIADSPDGMVHEVVALEKLPDHNHAKYCEHNHQTYHLPERLHLELKQMAAMQGRSIAVLATEAIMNYVWGVKHNKS